MLAGRLKLLALAAICAPALVVAEASTNAPIIVFTASIPATVATVWPSNSLPLYHGHTPLSRAPNINRPPVSTNPPRDATSIVYRAKGPDK